MDIFKICVTCKRSLPQSDFYRREPPRNPYTSCKSCVINRASAYALANKQKIAAKQRGYKENIRQQIARVCCKCKQTLPSSEFFGTASCCKPCYKTSYRTTRTRYYSRNRTLINKKFSAYLLSHKAQINTRRRTYYASHKVEFLNYYHRTREQLKPYRAKYYAKNSDRLLAYGRNQRRQLTDAYVRTTIRNNSGGIPMNLIPDSLIETKRIYIKVKRLIKEKSK